MLALYVDGQVFKEFTTLEPKKCPHFYWLCFFHKAPLTRQKMVSAESPLEITSALQQTDIFMYNWAEL